MNKKNWFYIALACIAVSIASLFTSIITYTTESGKQYSFSIIDLIGGSSNFESIVYEQYNGPVILDITGTATAVLAVIAVLAILCAVAGLVTLRAQRSNIWQFILTLVGLAGVAVPSVALLVCIFGYGKYYRGTIGCGISPIITPIAMIISITVVIRRKNRVAEELRKEVEAKGLIREAKDL